MKLPEKIYNDVVTGFKGLNKDLISNSYQFIPDKWNILNESKKKLKVCTWGFHFCKELKDVDLYYKFDNKNYEFWKIEAKGNFQHSDNKSCCTEIRLIEKINIYEHLLEEKLKLFTTLPENTILGGSAALMLQGVIPFRICKDLDIVQHYFTNIKNASFNYNNGFSHNKEATGVIIGLENLDLFIDPCCFYKFVEFRNYKYKVQLPEKIIEAKMRYFMQGIEKHGEDIKQYINWKIQNK